MNPTQVVGVTAFGAATLACITRGKGAWRVAAILYGIAALDVATDLRFRLKSWIEPRLLEATTPMIGKRPFQATLLVISALALVSLLIWTLRRDDPARPARIGIILLAGVYGTELISLHQVDHLIYTNVGPFVVVGWLWALVSGWTVIGAIWPALRNR